MQILIVLGRHALDSYTRGMCVDGRYTAKAGPLYDGRRLQACITYGASDYIFKIVVQCNF
jgi:hypothetical protein